MLPNEFLGKKLFVANATTIDDDWSDLLTDSTITTTIIWKSYHLIQFDASSNRDQSTVQLNLFS